MKTYIVFNAQGDSVEKNTASKLFNPMEFIDYKLHKKYDNYVVLYNNEEGASVNISRLFFTEDIFVGSIAVLRINEDDIISNFTVKMYCSKYSKLNKDRENSLYYSSDEC